MNLTIVETIARWDVKSDTPHPWALDSAEILCKRLGLDPDMDVDQLKELVNPEFLKEHEETIRLAERPVPKPGPTTRWKFSWWVRFVEWLNDELSYIGERMTNPPEDETQ